MNTATLNARKYVKLLGKALPVVISTDAEHTRMLAAVEELTARKEEELSEEEGRLLELLGVLVEEYEDRVYPLPNVAPHKMLAYLLEDRGLERSALWPILPKSRVSEILAGKRSM